MNDTSLIISAKNRFAIRLAHARATGMNLKNISAIDHELDSFTVSTITKNVQCQTTKSFIKWCKDLTDIKHNSIELKTSYQINAVKMV